MDNLAWRATGADAPPPSQLRILTYPDYMLTDPNYMLTDPAYADGS